MENLAIEEKITEIFKGAIVELFEQFDCETRIVEKFCDVSNGSPIACISAGSPELEVSIALKMPMSVLAMTYPNDSIMSISDEVLEDWVSEIANLTIGKLKNQLVKHECTLILGLPKCSFGLGDNEDLFGDGQTSIFYVSVDGPLIECSIDIQFLTEQISFNFTPAEDDGVSDGDIEFF